MAFYVPPREICCNGCAKKITVLKFFRSKDTLLNHMYIREGMPFICFPTIEDKIFIFCGNCFKEKTKCKSCKKDIKPITNAIESFDHIFNLQSIEKVLKDLNETFSSHSNSFDNNGENRIVSLQCIKCASEMLQLKNFKNVNSVFPPLSIKFTPNNEDNIKGLNDDCFIHVISFLTFPNDILLISLVCKKWCHFIYESNFGFLSHVNCVFANGNSLMMKEKKTNDIFYDKWGSKNSTCLAVRKMLSFLSFKKFKGFPMINGFDFDFFCTNIVNDFFYFVLLSLIHERNQLKTIILSKNRFLFDVFLKKIGDIRKVEHCYVVSEAKFGLISEASHLKSLFINDTKRDSEINISKFKLLERIRVFNTNFKESLVFVGCESMEKSSNLKSINVYNANVKFKKISLNKLKKFKLRFGGQLSISTKMNLDYLKKKHSKLEYFSVRINGISQKDEVVRIVANNTLSLKTLKIIMFVSRRTRNCIFNPSSSFFKNVKLCKLSIFSMNLEKIVHTHLLRVMDLNVYEEENAKSVLKYLHRFKLLQVLKLNLLCEMNWFKHEMLDFLKDLTILKRISFQPNLEYVSSVDYDIFYEYLYNLLSKCKSLKSFYTLFSRSSKKKNLWSVLPLFKINQLEELDIIDFRFPQKTSKRDFLKDIQTTKLKRLGVDQIDHDELDYIIKNIPSITSIYFRHIRNRKSTVNRHFHCYNKQFKCFY